ncbi:gamma-glutamyltransferase [Pseudomonas aeruginosa]|uniref:gamma-glutamyltransferase n=1 Tax=Pseudomonas aeruginosa TaxID=287 RepID=UPI002A913C50|nr:gamma-glutamyltransferase [Pseudomonas aeruginosa]
MARAIVGHAERSGGYLRAEDLAGYQAKWVEPISLNYRGYDVWEIHQPAAVDAGLGRGTAARGLRRQPPCADRRARARSQPRPAEAGRHGVP